MVRKGRSWTQLECTRFAIHEVYQQTGFGVGVKVTFLRQKLGGPALISIFPPGAREPLHGSGLGAKDTFRLRETSSPAPSATLPTAGEASPDETQASSEIFNAVAAASGGGTGNGSGPLCRDTAPASRHSGACSET